MSACGENRYTDKLSPITAVASGSPTPGAQGGPIFGILRGTPLSDIADLTRTFVNGTPGGDIPLGAECLSTTIVPGGTDCSETRQIATGGTVTRLLAPAPSATPVPVGPLWLLGVMAGLLSLVGIRKLRKG